MLPIGKIVQLDPKNKLQDLGFSTYYYQCAKMVFHFGFIVVNSSASTYFHHYSILNHPLAQTIFSVLLYYFLVRFYTLCSAYCTVQ